MARSRFVLRSLLPATALLVAMPTLAGTPAAYGKPDTALVAQSRPVTDRPPEAVRRTATHGTFKSELLAKAVPDECFAGVGVPYPPGPPCAAGQPKVNQGYVWGLTKVDERVWFGTGANVNCLTTALAPENLKPIKNDDYTCEFDQSPNLRPSPSGFPTLDPRLGDWRQPEIYLYDTSSGELTEKTGDISSASTSDAERLRSTAGIRAAGSHQGVVLLGGPGTVGSNLFAFDSATGRYLGSRTLTQFGNIRHFSVADGTLYAGLGIRRDGQGGGAVLRWTGDKSHPFSFDPVGILPIQVADLTAHDGRLFATTWASFAADMSDRPTAGIWMSPRLATGKPGLTKEDSGGWTKVWDVSDYEPDPVVASMYYLGGLASYGGYLYWGTMHMPLRAMLVHKITYPPADDSELRKLERNTQRSGAIFRGDFSWGRKSVELLYGSWLLPAFDPKAYNGAGAWRLAPTGYIPRFGRAGFGNGYNNYIWKMVVADGKLFIGTMDWSYLSKEVGSTLRKSTATAVVVTLGNAGPESYGADLWVFDAPDRPARAVDTTGLGNYLNYGIRNMIADGSTIYLGMANPMNLRTNPNDDVPEGGWELIKLTPADEPSSTAVK